MVWARQQKVGKQGPKFTLVVLGELCDDEGRTNRSQGYIADILECRRATVTEHLAVLEQGGWITRERRMAGNRRLSDVIQLNLGRTISVDLSDPEEQPKSEGSISVHSESERSETVQPECSETVQWECSETVQHKDKSFNLREDKKDTASAAAPAAEEPLGPGGYPMTTQGLVAEWIDHCDPKPLPRVIGQMSREIKNCLTAGADFMAVRNGVIEVEQKGLSPATLQSVVHHLQQARRTPMQPAGQHQRQPMATGSQRALQAIQAGAMLQAQHDQQQMEGTQLGAGGGRRAIGESGHSGPPTGGRANDSDVVGNPRPFVFQ